MKMKKASKRLGGKKKVAFLPALLQDYFDMCMKAVPDWSWKKNGGISVRVMVKYDNENFMGVELNFTVPDKLVNAIRLMPEGAEGRMDISKFEATHGFMCRGDQALATFNGHFTWLDGHIISEGQEFIPAKHRRKIKFVENLRQTFGVYHNNLLALRKDRSDAKRALGILDKLAKSVKLKAIGQAYVNGFEKKIREQKKKCESCVQRIRLADCEGSMLRIIGFSCELGEWLEERQSNVTVTYESISENGDPRYRFRTPKGRKIGAKRNWVTVVN